MQVDQGMQETSGYRGTRVQDRGESCFRRPWAFRKTALSIFQKAGLNIPRCQSLSWKCSQAPSPQGPTLHTGFLQAVWATLPAALGSLTSHFPRRPVSCSRDQMLWILPACSGWLLLFPQVHWCFSISVSYTRPAER